MNTLTSMHGKRGLILTIILISIYWGYLLWVSFYSTAQFPATFSELLIQLLKVKTFYFVVIFFLLRLVGERFQDVGFTSANWPRQVLIGLGLGIAIWIFVHVVLNTALKMIHPVETTSTFAVSKYIQDVHGLIIWFIISIFGGGVVEELQRAYVLTRFKKWGGRSGLYFAFGVSSILFGMSHLYQGVNMAISAGIAGMLYGLVFLRRNSLMEAISCHAVYDIIGVSIAYAMG